MSSDDQSKSKNNNNPNYQNKVIQKPKKKSRYVELIKGLQWADDLSGIKLSRGTSRLTHRGEKDRFDGKETEGYGVVDHTPSVIAEVPEGADTRRIDKAIEFKILREYDPENPPADKVDPDEDTSRRGLGGRSKDFEFDNKLGKLKFIGSNAEAHRLLQLRDDDIISAVERIKQVSMLEDLYKYEQFGYNSKAAPRFEVINALKNRLQSDEIRGTSNVKMSEQEKIKVL